MESCMWKIYWGMFLGDTPGRKEGREEGRKMYHAIATETSADYTGSSGPGINIHVCPN